MGPKVYVSDTYFGLFGSPGICNILMFTQSPVGAHDASATAPGPQVTALRGVPSEALD